LLILGSENGKVRVMKNKWFKEYGMAYLPISWQGWIVTLVALIFCGQVFVAMVRSSHSVSDTFFGVFPYMVSCLVVWYFVASKKVKKW